MNAFSCAPMSRPLDTLQSEFLRRQAMFDAGWTARVAGCSLADNPAGEAALPKASRNDAELWANGWLSADEFLALGVSNWAVEGGQVRCLNGRRLSGPDYTGLVGTIVEVPRWSLLGWIRVRFPPRGRQKTARETYFDLRRGDVEPA